MGENAYRIEGPALISFSGGRTSAYMLNSLPNRLRAAPHLIRDVDGDGLMLTVEPLAFHRVGHNGRGVYVHKKPTAVAPSDATGGRPAKVADSSPATLSVPACTPDSASRGVRPSLASAGADVSDLLHGSILK
ncbi:hypothetical protein [Sphingobium sp. YR768]|uniref:hypothetical protein n=1 Tax=Sphingobium sp. YR768 TaxID=1884365 RepID=UPI0008B4D059|nr:hypothetical protein [Sphingobium sp. YR768]SES08169.1 hypothetical protein SAMN05518866_13719 [Sphingobium sp. YR768]